MNPRRIAGLTIGTHGGGADEVDIPAVHCTLPAAMPEVKPPGAPNAVLPPGSRPDASREDAAGGSTTELPRFDESTPRPVASIELQDGTTLDRLVGVMRRLLAPDGCPWDREQSFETLRKYVLEEACEVIDAIDAGDRPALREELGDLLLQVVFQAELARARGQLRHRRRGRRHRRQAGAPPSPRLRRRFGQGRRRGAPELGEAEGEGEGRTRRPRRRPPQHAGADALAAHRREGGARRLRLGGRSRLARQGGRGAGRARPRHRERRRCRHRGGDGRRALRAGEPLAPRQGRRRGRPPPAPSTSSPAASPTSRSASARSTAAGARPGEESAHLPLETLDRYWEEAKRGP